MQQVEIRWAKSNHEGGSIRIGIVTVAQMFNYTVHDMFTIHYGCFAWGRYPFRHLFTGQAVCHGNWCVSDTTNRGCRIPEFTIPTFFPEGVYVLAGMWYGGIDCESRSHDRFSDYNSCVFSRINGGPSADSHQPFFSPVNNDKCTTNAPGGCLTSSDRTIDCETSCDGTPAVVTLSQLFQNGIEMLPRRSRWPYTTIGQ